MSRRDVWGETAARNDALAVVLRDDLPRAERIAALDFALGPPPARCRVVARKGATASPYFTDGREYEGWRSGVGVAITVRDDRGFPRVVVPDGQHCPHFFYAYGLRGGWFELL